MSRIGPDRITATRNRYFPTTVMKRLLTLLLLGLPAGAQDPLSLPDAVRTALAKHPALEAAGARTRAAEARIQQARGGNLPRVTWQESFQSGNNPVYVFGALLTQRQFTAANFDLQRLNRPDALNNFQTQLTAEQLLYDFGGRRNGILSAEIGRKMTEEERRRDELQLIAGVARAYHGVTLTRQALAVAEEAVLSAEADLKRAETVLAAGLATEADVLSVRVHLSSMREQRIARSAQLEVAHAALNEALGLPLDTAHTLSTGLTAALPPADANFEAQAAAQRPEVQQARLAQQMAAAQGKAVHAQMWPQFFVRGTFELDRQEFANKAGGNWMLGAGMRWTLFEGKRVQNAEAETRHLAEAARAGERQAASAVQLDVRMARGEFRAASERIAVGEASVSQAEESLRIIRNRYQNGLANVTDLLRAQTALVEARTRRLAAVYDQRMAAIRIEQAAGLLNGDSSVLK
jgi:outer membrane protein TolC